MSKNKPEIQTSIRPEYHYSLPAHHIYSPTGLIFIKGIYHLFLFKRNIDLHDSANTWAHLISKDLIHWTEQKVIDHKIKKGSLHSGYIVLDSKNTTGLGSGTKDPLVAIFNHEESEHLFHLQYSKDNGVSWNSYGKGPIIDTKQSMCRDPFVFWHEGFGKWVMLITIPHEYKVQFYSSKNLIKWELISDFGSHPSFNKKWAHASMIPCRSKQNKDILKWILMISMMEGDIPNRYFVGEFDGKSFKCDHALDAILKIDHGRDFCAPTLCNVSSEHRAILIGELSHVSYQQHQPTIGWKGMLTLPREIHVSKEADGTYRLVQSLLKEWPVVRSAAYEFTKSPMTNEVEWDIPLSDTMEFDLTIDSHKGCTIEFDFGSKTKLFITWDVQHHLLSLDRTNKNLAFHPSYSSYDQASLSAAHTLSIHIILDKYSIDIFADGGKVCLTSLIYSPHSLQRFRLIGKQFAAGGMVWHLGNS